MSGDIYDILVKKDYSKFMIEEWSAGPDYIHIGRMTDKTDWHTYSVSYSQDYDHLLEEHGRFEGDFTMTEFVKFLEEYADDYMQLINQCEAIRNGSQETLELTFGWPYRVCPIRWWGRLRIEDPVLARMLAQPILENSGFSYWTDYWLDEEE